MHNRIGKLAVSSNGRFLTYADGAPFFYLGDTAWEIFHKLDRNEVDHYLINRAGKGFNVVQAVILAELNGLTEPNRYGHLPLDDRDPAKPNEGYFEHVDYVIHKAAEQGLYVGLLPTWGAQVVKENHSLFQNYPIFTPENARVYGRFLGKRYRDAKNVLWILGGDRSPEGYIPIWTAMAEGLRDGDGGIHLISYHPGGGSSSSRHLHEIPWLDFNMLQSGHSRIANPNHEMIAADYAMAPAKPTFDAEPNYEGGAVGFSEANRMWFGDYDVRRASYWSVFAGGCGVTYGHNAIWQMWSAERPGPLKAAKSWRESLDDPASYQMRHLRRLMESRPFTTRIPDQNVILSPKGKGTDYIAATRDGTPGKVDATYLMAYTPLAHVLKVNSSLIPGKRLRAWWYDPRTGVAYYQGEADNTGEKAAPWHTRPFDSPGPDWVFVVDDASRKYPPPGSPLG